MNFPPSSAGFGCEYLVRSSAMITTKSVPVSLRTRSAYGCNSRDGSGRSIARTTYGESATASATFTERSRADSSWSRRAST